MKHDFMGLIIGRYAFQPPHTHKSASSTGHLTIVDRDGHEVDAVYIRHPKAQHVLLYSHGNAEDLQSVGTQAAELSAALECDVLCYDYCGYGHSGDPHPSSSVALSPCEACCYSNVLACYDYLLAWWSPSSIVIYGRSLGSGPSTWLASKYPCRALILESGFTSVVNCVMRGATNWLPVDMFSNYWRLNNVTAPILLFHGTHDDVVPYEHAEAMAARGATLKTFDAGHNDMDRNREAINDEIRRAVLVD